MPVVAGNLGSSRTVKHELLGACAQQLREARVPDGSDCGGGDRPVPPKGDRSVEELAVWSAAVRVRHRGLGPALVVLYLVQTLSRRVAPAGLAQGDTDGYIRECRSWLHTPPAWFGSFARGMP
jgi:hypothetical protein